MKKLISLILALALVMGLAVSASAEGTAGGTITITNAVAGETYTVYKVFDATGDGTNISYKLVNGKTTAPNGFFVDAAGNVSYTGSGTDGQLTADDIAAIATYVANDTAAGTVTPETGGNATVSVPSAGYYYITTSLGSVVTVDSTNPNASVQEKNSVPAIDKTEKLASGSEYVDDSIDVNYGDTVNYKLVITDGTGTDKPINVMDIMAPGITYTANSLKINGTTVADNADTDNWKVTVSGQTITIEFKAVYVTSLDKDATITVTYDATVNNSATVDSNTANSNSVTMTYSAQSIIDVVYVATYDFLLKKTDGTNYLPGAGFKLYDAETDGNLIKVGKDDAGYYVGADTGEEIMVDSENGVKIRGLAPGTYYLEETTVPAGYNKLAERKAVTITTGAKAPVEVIVENSAGSALPSTGGIGTTLFYVIGGLLMAGAAVLLITKKRMS